MTNYEQILSWIQQKTNALSSKKYAKNLVHINQGLKEIGQLETELKEWQPKVDCFASKTFDSNKKKNVLSAFDCLKELLAKKKHCLETMHSVAQLEEHAVKISYDFDKKATELSKESQKEKDHPCETTTNIVGFISSAAQDCVFGLRDNWDWIAEVMRCSSVHLKNASDYHKFFHEIEESEQWLDVDLRKFKDTFEKYPVDGKPGDAEEIIREIDSVNTALRQWEVRVTRLWNESTKLLPVPMRVSPVRTPAPAHLLADYETNEINVRAGEEIILLDNGQSDRWKIRNGKGQEAHVPPVLVIIPGPDQQCISAADKLRLHLLATWTNLLKRVGVRLICYAISVFQPDYSQKEINALKSMEELDKEKLMKILSEVEESLKKYWADHDGFVNIQERISALRLILEEFGDEKGEDYANLCRAMIVKIDALGQIINIYQDLNKNWEKFKVSVEASRAPELMMIVDKWEQLQFVSREYFSKFWKMKLPLNDQEKLLMNSRNYIIDGIPFEDIIDTNCLSSPRPQSATITTVPKFTDFQTPQIKLISLDDKIQFKVGVPASQQNTDDSHVTSTTIMTKASYPTIKFTVELGQNHHDKETSESGFEETKVVIRSSKDGEKKEEGTSEHGFMETKVFETRFGAPKSVQTAQVNDAVDHLFQQMSSAYNESGRGGTKGQLREAGNTDCTATSTNAKVSRTFNVVNPSSSPSDFVEEFGFDETKIISNGSKVSDDSSNLTLNSSRPLTQVATRVNGTSEHQEHQSSGDCEEILSFNRATGSDYEGTAFGFATETKTAETEQLSSAEMEESKTFVIGSVLSTADDTEISFQQAILSGIIKPSEGVYIDSKNDRRLPIATAMSDGFIRVVHCKTQRSQEKFSSIGIITIKTVRELIRPYSIVWVKDTKTNEEVDQREACHRGILDEKQGCFIDRCTGESMLIVEAAEKGLAKVEYPSDPAPAPEVIVKIYAVRAVVDRRLKKTITFHDAVKRGIIDKESGAFKDTVTGERMYVGDAIMRGFLKARLIEDANGLNIDPQNKMIIDKTQKIREKLLKPLQVISAFKAAAKRPGSASSPKK